MQCPKLGRLPMTEGIRSPQGESPRPRRAAKLPFTPRQGQFLAFIHLDTKLNRHAPAEADMAKYFRVSPPTVHAMVTALHERRLISRQPGESRSIRLVIDPATLPPLD